MDENTSNKSFVILEAWNASNDSVNNASLIDSSSREYSLFNINERLIFTILTSIILATLTILTAVGNLFVMIAIWIDRNLRNVQNYLIFSLAFADLMVSCSVMPLGALYEVIGEWTLGTVLCDVWTSTDVFCCTASILHLVAIALDRYWAVTNVDYIHRRTPTRILTLIAFVWIGAIIVCIPPIFGLKDADYEHRVLVEKRCLYSQDIGYQVFATITTFYGPVTVILLLYWKIYQVSSFAYFHANFISIKNSQRNLFKNKSLLYIPG
ncbi:type 1 serotonin receptor-like protein [Leptotrombidium deliense]|uniref:Type 1 serotonin receptor-like protein n=1 Tax=Leptotrombidium deliense TaxID=299467 RepID=A0A443SSQ4_9ACAR|nr:type 1 serotonin receptor-like protein [Leptotrombidium deliense]